MIAVADGTRGHAAGIGAEAGFGEAEAADGLAGLEARQPMLFLLLGAEGENRVHDEAALHAGEGAEPGIAAFNFLHDQAIFDAIQAGAAIAVDIGAEESEFAHLADQVGGEAAVVVAVFDDGEDLFVDELAGGLSDEAFVIGEEGVKVEVVNAFEGRHTTSW